MKRQTTRNFALLIQSYREYFSLKRIRPHAKIRVFEVMNISSLKWYTMKREFMLYVEIPAQFFADQCTVQVHSHLLWGKTVLELTNKMNTYYQLESLSPMYLMDDLPLWSNSNPQVQLYRFSHAVLYLIYNVQSSWLDAKKHCESLGSHLLALDSFEQWPIVMDNVRYMFPSVHQAFWMSSFLFLGKTNTVSLHDPDPKHYPSKNRL